VPTFNESDNVEILIERLDRVLRGIDWEVVFVDDDSPDGTTRRVRALASETVAPGAFAALDGAVSAPPAIEGMLSTSAPLVAVIDGDLQHDESLLPRMRDMLKQDAGEKGAGKQDMADVVDRPAGNVGSGSSEGTLRSAQAAFRCNGARLARRLVKAECRRLGQRLFHAAPRAVG